MTDRRCKWMQHGFMSVNTDLAAGRAFLRSLYQQYAEWGVDFVKHDCVFGDDFDIKELSKVSEILKELDRPIVYSISPATIVMPDMAKQIYTLGNMYRITGDDWDNWDDVRNHFSIARDIAAANLIGAEGLNGRSWPDMDMMLLGWVNDQGSSRGPFRKTNLNPAEQKTLMALWSMVKSPLMHGGDLRKIDEATLKLITNPTILEIDNFSQNNKQMWEFNHTGTLVNSCSSLCAKKETMKDTVNNVEARAWIATGRKGEIYVTLFNLSTEEATIYAKIKDIADALSLGFSSCAGTEIWSGEDIKPTEQLISVAIGSHDCALFVLTCN